MSGIIEVNKIGRYVKFDDDLFFKRNAIERKGVNGLERISYSKECGTDCLECPALYNCPHVKIIKNHEEKLWFKCKSCGAIGDLDYLLERHCYRHINGIKYFYCPSCQNYNLTISSEKKRI